MRILLADDSAVSRRLLGRMLEAWGYEVVPCADGDEAWAMLDSPESPQIAILDWVMPGIDGIELCRRLRDRSGERHVFVYLLTAKTSPEDMLAGLEAGADDYLTKPVSGAELRIRLRNGRRLVELHEELIRTREVMRNQAMVDPLTELWNRRAFIELAGKELSRADRHARPTAFLICDLDHFKSVNDTLGHPAGDRVLKEAAERLKAGLREGDQIARYGGEEFVVLLAGCSARGAWIVSERLRRLLSKSPMHTDAGSALVTGSFGGCVSGGERNLEALLADADKALYRAKRGGRDRTHIATLSSPDSATGLTPAAGLRAKGYEDTGS